MNSLLLTVTLSRYSFPNSQSLPSTATTSTLQSTYKHLQKVFQNVPEAYNTTILVVLHHKYMT